MTTLTFIKTMENKRKGINKTLIFNPVDKNT